MATDRQTVASQITAAFAAIATPAVADKWGGYLEWLEQDTAEQAEEVE